MSNANNKDITTKNDTFENIRSNGKCDLGFHSDASTVLNLQNNIEDGSIAIHPRGNGAVSVESGLSGAGNGTITLRTAGNIELVSDNVNGIQPQDVVDNTRATILNTDTELLADNEDKNLFLRFEATGGGNPNLDFDDNIENGLVATVLFTTDGTSTCIVRAINGSGGGAVLNKFLGLTTLDDPATLSSNIDGYVIGNNTTALMRFTNFDNGAGATNEFYVEVLGYDGTLTVST